MWVNQSLHSLVKNPYLMSKGEWIKIWYACIGGMFKHRNLLRVPHFTVILLNIRAQFLFYWFVSPYTIKHLLLLEIQRGIQNSVKCLRWRILESFKPLNIFGKSSILDVLTLKYAPWWLAHLVSRFACITTVIVDASSSPPLSLMSNSCNKT